jgi:predicted ATPase
VLAERIDRLPREQKRVLQSAAVVGRVFWTGAVSELAELDPSAELESLNEREMVQPHGQATFADDLEWIFRHVLVQEVAYSGLLKETRRQAHLRVARWLEERIRERQSEHSSLLAHHYELGEEWGKTAEWAEVAGDRAAALFAHREARISFVKALSALNKTEQREDARVIDLSLKLARVSFYTATEDVQEALQRAKELADQSGDRERQVQVSTAMASWLYMAGRARPAVEMAMQSMANATALGLEDQLVVPYFILGRAVYAMGDYRRAAEMLERSNELAHQYGDNMDEISVSVRAGATLAFLGMTYQLMGQRQRGRNLALESLAASEAKRDLSRVASANLYLGTAPALFGLLDEALSHLERALSVAEEIGDFSVAYVARGFLGYCYEQRGEVDRGLQHLDQAIALASELDSFLFVSLLEAYRAEALIRGGRAAEAVAVAERAIRMAQETRQLGCEGETHRVHGWALHYGGGSREEAVREMRLAADIHLRTGAPIVRARALYELAALLRLIGDDQGAGEADAQAAAIAHETGAMWLPVQPPTPLTVSAEEPGRHATGRPNAP